MKSAVSNSGPLIHLAKVGLLELLKKYEIIIPSQVKLEVVDKGKELGHSDALLVEKAIEEGWIKEIQVENDEKFSKIAEISGLHEAEIAAILYSYKNKYVVLLDDDPARIFARNLGLEVRGSLGILIQGAIEEKVSYKMAKNALDNLAEIMFLSSTIYKFVDKKLKEIEP